MKATEIRMARVYNLEGKDCLDKVLDILHEDEKIVGVTVMRGVAGYGSDGEIHTSSLLTLSLELPIIIEFYDTPEKVAKAIHALKAKLDLKHIVSWPANAH
jgi:uncharacterized protein